MTEYDFPYSFTLHITITGFWRIPCQAQADKEALEAWDLLFSGLEPSGMWKKTHMFSVARGGPLWKWMGRWEHVIHTY